jgi:thiol-disulfide isomerase/thioredoxin
MLASAMKDGSLTLRNPVSLLTIGLMVLGFGCDVARHPQPAMTSQTAADEVITLPDVNGQSVQPLAIEPGQRATVLIFVAADCPICNAYAGEINRLNQAYSKQGVRFFLVDVDANLSAADALKHTREYALTPTVLLDPNRVLPKKYAATTTPEVILLDQTGRISYRGRIDDLYICLGQRRYEAHEHDLRDAVDAMLAGRPISVAVTKAVGCSI